MADEIQKLKTDINLNQTIIFIGTHVSFYTTDGEQEVAHWKGLLKHGLHRCRRSAHFNDAEFQYFSSRFNSNTATVDDYLLVANRIKDSMKRKSNTIRYKSWFLETIGKLVAKKPELIQAIGELQFPILTTNYDSLLTDILGRKPIAWNQYCIEANDNAMEDMHNCILHLHGHFQDLNTIIFSSGDYKRLRQSSSSLSKLRALLKNKTLLFIGYDTGIPDPHLSNLLEWISQATNGQALSMYQLVQSDVTRRFNLASATSFSSSVRFIHYGTTPEDLLSFVKGLKSFTPIIRDSLLFADNRHKIRRKYLDYLIHEYGNVSIFGSSNENIHLPLESVYVELKFDPTHPSIKAMQNLEINEEFKRKILSYGFFDENERNQINRAVFERNILGFNTICQDFMVDQWLTLLLSNRNIFTVNEAIIIKDKINRLKQSIMEKNSFQEPKQYRIQQAYQEFKHFIILGHPGSGKTTLSKWLVINLAKECLGEQNMLFDEGVFMQKKIPIIIPIWKYVDQIKQQTPDGQQKTLLHFTSENPICSSSFFNAEERRELSLLMMESIIQGNVLVIFEGLDEVPAHVDRSDLMKEMNTLLERGIDYDANSHQLTSSFYEQKEINNIKDPHTGNRFIITSRIEGNYFEDINFYIPRLTIEDMSNEALRLFCRSYMQCIQEISSQTGMPDQLYDDISQNKDIFQLAINPQLASVIAAVYNQCNGQLPEKRVDLYERAIETMIERLINPENHLNIQSELNATLLWSILQEIAEYLHSKVESLSESVLKQIIKRCLVDPQQGQHHSSTIDELISKLMNIFKYQAGVLSEFGQDKFRFIHRTFQEYLAARCIIFLNGSERSEDIIFESIISKINIPNWRVPLNMAFGILSKRSDHNSLFDRILTRLLTKERVFSSDQVSTSVVPFVIADSIRDMCFSSKNSEDQLIQRLADLLLMDYQHTTGFARSKEHQELIHSYFFKLKETYEKLMTEWFLEKINDPQNLPSCAHVIYQLKWYTSDFYKIFLKNLHNDCLMWNWPINTLLQFYSNEIKHEAVVTELKFRNFLNENPQITDSIIMNDQWLCLITALYGGYKNHNTPSTISEYYEIAHFLGLNEKERAPFIFYYQEIWGRENPAYNMAVHLDSAIPKHLWNATPRFEITEINKESFLTSKILEQLFEDRPAMGLIDELRAQIEDHKLHISDRIAALIVLVALGDVEFIHGFIDKGEKSMIRSFANRIEQLIDALKDPIARWSSSISKYLLAISNDMKVNSSEYQLRFIDYCQIYLSLTALSGGISIDTKVLAETVEDIQDKCDLYAEYWAWKFTGTSDDIRYEVAVVLDECISTRKCDQIIKSFLKISETIQIYKPIREYAWPLDVFNFKWKDEHDIPIALFNCLENLNTKLAFVIPKIWDVFIKEGYLDNNAELKPLVILFNLAITTRGVDTSGIFDALIPELAQKTNIKEFLYEMIQTMCNPYYKSRALYQLAELYDRRSYELLYQSFMLAKDVAISVLKFQVLENIYSVTHYKEVEHRSFIQEIFDELIVTLNEIVDLSDRVIASIRLSFYRSGEFRHKYLASALQTLVQMDENDEQIALIIKLQPLICLYDDLQIILTQFIQKLSNQTYRYLIQRQYGQILSMEHASLHILHSKSNQRDYIQLETLFLLFAQLNDVRLMINETETLDQLWNNLFRDPENEANLAKILEIGIRNELFLTPQVAMILDELLDQGKQDRISILFPYLIKPSNEVLPIIQRWFTDFDKQPIRNFAALLLVEAKRLFESAIDPVTDLLHSENDQIRYRAQRLFQHPELGVEEPSKRASIIGEKALCKILENLHLKEHPISIQAYLGSLFYDLLWDDPIVFQNLYTMINNNGERRINIFPRTLFISNATWNLWMETLRSDEDPIFVENIFECVLVLTQHDQITEDNWTEFARVLAGTDTSQFKEQVYFTHTDEERIEFMLNEISALTDICDETYFQILESKIISELSNKIENLAQNNLQYIKHLGGCFFYTTRDLNERVLNMLNSVSINNVLMENLIRWLVQTLIEFTNTNDTYTSIPTRDCLLSLLAGCVQKDDYLYRKITNRSDWNKCQLIELFEKIIHYHRSRSRRGSAFILLAALDQINHKVIINAMNTLCDENHVKEYVMIGVPLIHLSPNKLLDDILESLRSESAVKVYEILKIFTQFVLNETIEADGKSKILNYLANQIGKLRSKKPINYYYTDIKLPFTTTLENEFYKAWIKIQGLSGKTQYMITNQSL